MGMSWPTGTSSRTNVPSGFVVVDTTGNPEAGAWQAVHVTPAAKGAVGAFGT